jgi:hypothetical protein
MRSKLALAGLVAGLAAAFFPVASASANCTPPVVDNGQQCADDGCDTYDALKAKFDRLPGRPFECTQ